MKNLKLSYKIILINIAIALFLAIVLTIAEGTGGPGDFAIAFGLLCLAQSLLNFFVGLIMLFARSKEWSKGFFLSGAALLLLSGLSCDGGVALAYTG